MNLSEALDAALPEIRRSGHMRGDKAPRMDPDTLMREDSIDGEPINVVYQRSTKNVFRFPPLQWQLACEFDGQRSYEEVAEAFTETTGLPLSADEARAFAANMDESDFWHKTSEEKNLALTEKLLNQRERKSKGAVNIAHIAFSAWDPDRYLTTLDKKFGRYLYSSWFTWFTVLLFCFEAIIFITKWHVLGPDIPLYYNFSKKGFGDLAEFWVLFLVLGFFHESAHGLTCKHFGGEVHSMGLMLLFLTPAFYVDVTEVWISANRMQRLATIIAGIWTEMIVCGIAMIVWTATQPGDGLHDFAYKLILITGIAVIVVNLNPLIKLDGYYFFTEWLRIPDLKERSTEFLSGLFQHHILRLPIDVPVVPRRRVIFFVTYAFFSGLYSYFMLFFVIRFSYNVFYHWIDTLAFFPALYFATLIFRSRIRLLGATMMKFYRTRISDGSLHVTPLKAVVGLIVAVLLFAPLWRDREGAFYLIEPIQTQVLRAVAPGRVANVSVNEGDHVSTGQLLATVDSLASTSHAAGAQAQLLEARNQVYAAETQHSGLGSALASQHAAQQLNRAAGEERSAGRIVAPFDGTIVTKSPGNIAGRDVGTGDPIVELAKSDGVAVRLFVSASEMNHIHSGDEITLPVPGRFSTLHMRLDTLQTAPVSLPEGVVSSTQYKGIELPTFYSTRIIESGLDMGLRPGMTGEAKVFDRKRSVASRMAETGWAFIRSMFW